MLTENPFLTRILWPIFAICITVTFALPTGAPQSACHDMTPRHRNNVAQLGALAPYRLNVSTSEIVCDQVIGISLTGLQSDDMFRGFFIEVRPLDANGQIGDDPIGEFVIPEASKEFARIVDCGDDLGVYLY